MSYSDVLLRFYSDVLLRLTAEANCGASGAIRQLVARCAHQNDSKLLPALILLKARAHVQTNASNSASADVKRVVIQIGPTTLICGAREVPRQKQSEGVRRIHVERSAHAREFNCDFNRDFDGER